MKTEDRLCKALKTLMATEPLDTITVKRLSQMCGINRQTFYYHYRDIYDLLTSIFLNERVEGLEQCTSIKEVISLLLEYIENNASFITNILNSAGRDLFKEFIYNVGKQSEADVVITEVGGTTGDIESQPFIEAIRQVGLEVGKENAIYIHVTLLPFLSGSDEHKTKPTQHSVKELQGMGIHPDIIVLRCDEKLEPGIFRKVAMFCNVSEDCVIENLTLPSLYEVPVMLKNQHMSDTVCRLLKIDSPEANINEWTEMLDKIHNLSKKVTMGLVGKYVQLHDAYLSVAEALRHAGYALGADVQIKWIDSETISEYSVKEVLFDVDGVIVPGGFGSRGIEGMILTANYCRENNLPYLGICLGMQIAVISFARYVAGLKNANSGEFDAESQYKVIDFLPDQNDSVNKGGTLRLGAYPCKVKAGTKMAECYGSEMISERHRHRYEFNNEFRTQLEEAGLTISGTSPDEYIVETVEIAENDFYVGVQFHPEFKSRPNRAHPLFVGLVKASLK